MYALAPIGVPNSTMIERIAQPPVQSRVSLPPVAPKEEDVAAVVPPDLLETKRMAYVFPADAAVRFSPDILNGFILDHEFTEQEKRSYLRGRPATPSFARRLYVEGSGIVVLGRDTYDPPEIPVGDDRTALLAWNAALLARFVAAKSTVFASLKNGKLTISKMTVEDGRVVRKLDKTGKKFEPIVCDTGENTTAVMNAFATIIDSRGVGLPMVPPGPGKPPKILTGSARCIYLELLAREESGCMWLAPEELAVLYDGKGVKGQPPTNQDMFTEAFRK